MTKKYHIVTFGCQMNKNDSEHIAGMFEYSGYQETSHILDANIVVYNTCAVRDKSERRVYGQIKKLNYWRKKRDLPIEIYIAGCMPAYNKAEILQENPFLDGVIDVAEAREYRAKRKNSPEAWVSIMQGCNNFCAYCIVPYARGREKSRTVEEILEEIAKLDLTKYEVVFLLGQNVNSFNGTYQGRPSNFAELIRIILKQFSTLPKLGYLTSHPKDMSDALIDVIATEPRIDREIHLPLQAGNDRILQLMNRGYTYAQYKNLVQRIRAQAPDVKISTDIIVGFPSETEADFQDSLTALREMKFHRVISSGYSIRTGTKAASLPDHIAADVINERLIRMNKLIEETKPQKKTI